MVLRLPEEMLAGAEADLEPNLPDRDREKVPQMAGSSPFEVEAETRQEVLEQPLLARAQGFALAPAIGPERPCLAHW